MSKDTLIKIVPVINEEDVYLGITQEFMYKWLSEINKQKTKKFVKNGFPISLSYYDMHQVWITFNDGHDEYINDVSQNTWPNVKAVISSYFEKEETGFDKAFMKEWSEQIKETDIMKADFPTGISFTSEGTLVIDFSFSHLLQSKNDIESAKIVIRSYFK